MRQQTLADNGFERFRKQTRREMFLLEMDQIIPWRDLCKVIKPFYPKRAMVQAARRLDWSGCCVFIFCNTGSTFQIRRLKRRCTIRVPCAALLASIWVASRRRMKRRCASSGICWRHTTWAASYSTLINEYLEENGLKVSTGTIVDATIIDAPTSTKNKEGKRDPEMHQTKKGNEWYFGMKGHIGVDSQTKLIHSVAATAANVHDSQLLGDLLHGDETRVWGDSAYSGQRDVIAEHAPRAKDFTNKKGARNRPLSAEDRSKNRTKSKVRAKGEHPFLILKRIFGFNKVRYRGLDKNANRLFVACGLVNLYMARRQLLRPTQDRCVWNSPLIKKTGRSSKPIQQIVPNAELSLNF